MIDKTIQSILDYLENSNLIDRNKKYQLFKQCKNQNIDEQVKTVIDYLIGSNQINIDGVVTIGSTDWDYSYEELSDKELDELRTDMEEW